MNIMAIVIRFFFIELLLNVLIIINFDQLSIDQNKSYHSNLFISKFQSISNIFWIDPQVESWKQHLGNEPQYSLLIKIRLYLLAMLHRKRRQSTRCKYVKVPIKTKLKFLRKVILEGFSIKDSATIFDINYSTAKTLIGQYKSHAFHWNLSSFTEETELDMENTRLKRCGYRVIEIDVDQKTDNSQGKSPCFYLWSDNHEAEELSLKMVSQLLDKKIQIISSTTEN